MAYAAIVGLKEDDLNKLKEIFKIGAEAYAKLTVEKQRLENEKRASDIEKQVDKYKDWMTKVGVDEKTIEQMELLENQMNKLRNYDYGEILKEQAQQAGNKLFEMKEQVSNFDYGAFMSQQNSKFNSGMPDYKVDKPKMPDIPFLPGPMALVSIITESLKKSALEAKKKKVEQIKKSANDWMMSGLKVITSTIDEKVINKIENFSIERLMDEKASELKRQASAEIDGKIDDLNQKMKIANEQQIKTLKNMIDGLLKQKNGLTTDDIKKKYNLAEEVRKDLAEASHTIEHSKNDELVKKVVNDLV